MENILKELITEIMLLGEAGKAPKPTKGDKRGVPDGLYHRGRGMYYTKPAGDKSGVYMGQVVGKTWQAAKVNPQVQKSTKPAPTKITQPTTTTEPSVTGVSTGITPPKNLPGAKGILDAIVGVTEKGSAGAGTKESRAAEASVVLLISDLLEKRKSSSEDIDTFLSQNDEAINTFIRQLLDLPKSAINDTWFNPIKRQVVGTMSEIEKRFGKISEVVWDNKEGRDRLGIQKQEGKDRSDLYVRLENGEIIGVSLKKDGNVFLANQGYKAIMETISGFAKNESTRKKIKDLQSLHETESKKALSGIVDYVFKNKESVRERLSQLKRTDIKDVESKDYDKYFDPTTGKINPETIEAILNGDLKGDKVKLLTKSLGVLAKSDTDIETLLTNLRHVDNAVTHKLIDLMNSDPEVNETVKAYMLDVLDMPQMLSTDPFPGVSRVVTVYGAGNVDETGNTAALFTDGSVLRETFGFSEGLSQDEITQQLSSRFIIDAEKDSRVGYIRLKIKNETPPPSYFYPTVASLGVRARGLGNAGVFELYQQNAWTFTLANRNPNPQSWSPAQRKAQAKDTLKFLKRQLESATPEEKVEIEKDIEFYKGIQ